MRKVGFRRETISFVENGEYNPSLLLAEKIARTFGTTVEEGFIFDEDETRLVSCKRASSSIFQEFFHIRFEAPESLQNILLRPT